MFFSPAVDRYYYYCMQYNSSTASSGYQHTAMSASPYLPHLSSHLTQPSVWEGSE